MCAVCGWFFSVVCWWWIFYYFFLLYFYSTSFLQLIIYFLLVSRREKKKKKMPKYSRVFLFYFLDFGVYIKYTWLRYNEETKSFTSISMPVWINWIKITLYDTETCLLLRSNETLWASSSLWIQIFLHPTICSILFSCVVM